jgi:hypothetical protein
MSANPVYGRDFRYEMAQLPKEKNVHECLDYITENQLKINYVPHLESISSLASSGSTEWRMYSGIPLDSNYYKNAFGPLLRYINKSSSKNKFMNNLKITFAAEIDNMVFGKAKDSIKIIQDLKSDLKRISKIKVPILLNTNGDFFHMWKIPQVDKKLVKCEDIRDLLLSVDTLSPSMYGEKGHFQFINKKISINKTIDHYTNSLLSSLPQACRKNLKFVKSLEVGFGEFALDMNKNQRYSDVFTDSEKLKYVQYWNHSKWDHIGLLETPVKSTSKQLINP